jgi:hypothetical protein
MLKAGLSEYATKQRLVRIQPTLDDHRRVWRVSFSAFLRGVSRLMLYPLKTRNEDLLESAIRSDIRILFSMIHKAIMNCLFIYVGALGLMLAGWLN